MLGGVILRMAKISIDTTDEKKTKMYQITFYENSVEPDSIDDDTEYNNYFGQFAVSLSKYEKEKRIRASSSKPSI